MSADSSENILLEAALSYARRGWPVLPLHNPVKGGCSCGKVSCVKQRHVGKHPCTRHGLKDATTDEATIRDWWSRWPDANLGIATGAVSGLVVLDVDPRHGGDESIRRLKLRPTVEALTGGGGWHEYFKHPDGFVPSGAEKLGLPGLDLKADGGYVVAPPSLHMDGGRYCWELSSSPDETALAPWPNLEVAHKKNGASAPLPPLISEGQRNAALTSLAGSMRRRGATPAAIEAALLEENSQRCQPPLREDEVRQIARSVGRYEPERGMVPSSPGGHVQIESICAADVVPQPIRWLWTGRIPFGKLTLVEGSPGLGKTLVLLDVAARCSAGKPLPLQAEAVDGSSVNVLIVSYEDGLADTLRPRIEAAGADLRQVHFVERVLERGNRGAVETLLALPEHIAELEEHIRALDARLVIIDPLMAAISGKVDAHKDQDVRRVLAELRNVAERTGAAVVAIRHLRKTNDGLAINAGQGSIGIIAAARAAHLVAKDPDDPDSRIFAVVKSNLGHHPAPLRFRVLEVKTSTGIGAPVTEWLGEAPGVTADMLVSADCKEPEATSALGEAVAFLSEALGEAPRLAKELKREGKEAGIAWRTMERAKRKLGVLVKRDGLGGAWRWHLPVRKTANSAGDGDLGGLGGVGDLPKSGPTMPGHSEERA